MNMRELGQMYDTLKEFIEFLETKGVVIPEPKLLQKEFTNHKINQLLDKELSHGRS